METKVLFPEAVIKEKVRELGEIISKDYEGKEIIAVCLLRGSFIFAADLIREIKPNVIVDFMSVSSYVGEETTGEVRILKDLDENVNGKHVLIVEDIIDTGLTLDKMLAVFKGRNPASLEICTLLSKPDRRRIDIDVKYVGFEIEDKYVLGYGFDKDQKYRQLKDIVEIVR
jgi:hypoxanthine phosphoribosyltransferase